jgi:hypothetical protein
MSEFSESYHLEADDQQAGVHLLQRAHLEGFVFPPPRGWVTIVPRSEFGEMPNALREANQGWLLRWLLDQDAGWMFEIFTEPILASSYECCWLDWRTWDSRIRVDTLGVDVTVVWTLAQRHGHHPTLLGLQRILHPRIQRRTDQASASTTVTLLTGQQVRRSTMWPTPSPGWLVSRTIGGSGGATTQRCAALGPARRC